MRMWTMFRFCCENLPRGEICPTSLHEAVLIAATLTMGLMAGVFAIYSNAIMPGLRRTDDRTFVAAFQSIDRADHQPAFMVTFLGALVSLRSPRCFNFAGEGRPLLPWIVAALVLYILIRSHHQGQRAAKQRDQGRR